MKIHSMALLLAFGATGAVQAETFTVTRFDDPQPDGCQPTDCSLREAAVAADSNDSGDPRDLILLGTGTYTLVDGELPLHQDLDVAGAGTTQTHLVTPERLFTAVDVSLHVRDLDFQTGSGLLVSAQNGPAEIVVQEVSMQSGGGNVAATGENGLTMVLRVEDSTIAEGVDCNHSTGSCTVEDSCISRLLVHPLSGTGPLVRVGASVVDGSLDAASQFTGVSLYRAADVEIADSTIMRTMRGLNDFGFTQVVRLLHVHYAENLAPARFGGGSDVTITDSVFESNPTRALYAENESTWAISGTSFVSNQVNGNAGGAIVVEDSASLDVENSTFSGNTFTEEAAADGARGAAIGYRNGSGAHLEMRHVTIVPPTDIPLGAEGMGIAGYGGVGEIVLNINNSILAASCRFDAGALHHATGNIESPGDTCGFSDSANQIDVSAANLALGSLGDYGGPTPTHEPSVASAAVDAASQGQCLMLDQRGYQRPYPAGADCDVGAVEVGAGDPIFDDGFE
jgi:hypothetical protein